MSTVLHLHVIPCKQCLKKRARLARRDSQENEKEHSIGKYEFRREVINTMIERKGQVGFLILVEFLILSNLMKKTS